MQGQWRPLGEDLPEKAGRALTRARRRAGSARTAAIAAGVVAVVLVVAVVVAVTGSGSGDAAPDAQDSPAASRAASPDASGAPDPASAPYPEAGDYRVQVLHSGYCLGVAPQEGRDRHALQQMACADAHPRMTFEAADANGVYRVKLHYPEDDWIACLTLDEERPGYLYGPQQCERPLLHDFTLEPAAEDTYRIKSPGGMCMDALDGGAEAGTLFAAAECSPAAASQRFRFDKQ